MTQFKVIFTGIQNAGKTSIIKVLDRQFHKLARLVPTKGAERSLSTILGFPVTKWDLGGQEKYRKEYLSSRKETLLESDVVIFVVDIQETETYTEAINYYKRVLGVLEEAGEKPDVIVCLHKADPEVYDNFKANITDLMKHCEDASKLFHHRFFVTSIYNRRSIIEAFSYACARFLPKKDAIDMLLKNFVGEVKEAGNIVEGVFLLDQNSIFISQIFENKKVESYSLTASMGILSTIESFEEVGSFSSLILEVNQEYQFYVRKVGDLYTVIVGKKFDVEKVWNLYNDNYLTDLEEILEKEE